MLCEQTCTDRVIVEQIQAIVSATRVGEVAELENALGVLRVREDLTEGANRAGPAYGGP